MSHNIRMSANADGEQEITLRIPQLTARILPGQGFNLHSLQYGNHELLMPRQSPDDIARKFGAPLLFPTPNRVRDACFTWQGKPYPQQKNGKVVDIHGLIWDEPFQTECWMDKMGAHARGVLEILPGSAAYESYPFPCRFAPTYTLRRNTLTLTIEVENLGPTDMPFGVALHPFFSVAAGESNIALQVPAHTYYEAVDYLPTGRILPLPAEMDLSDGFRPVSKLNMDHVLRGYMRKKAPSRIRYTTWDFEMRIAADNAFQNIVVFTPHTRPCFCIEPQTCAVDAHNLFARGLQEESGLIVLPPDTLWRGRILFTFAKAPNAPM